MRAFYSRYCKKKYLFRDPCHNKEGFSDDLLNCIRQEGVGLILPTWDKGIFDLLGVKEIILGEVKILFPMNYEKVSYIMNKKNIPVISKMAGINVVPTWLVDENFSISDMAEISPPYAIKLEYGVSGEGFKKIGNLKELDREVEIIKSRGSEKKYIAQKFIGGPVFGVGGIVEKGELKRFYCYRYVKRYPPLAGNSTLRVVDFQNSLGETLCKVLKAIKWEGFCHMDFVICDEDQRPYLLDINPVHCYTVPDSASEALSCLSYYVDRKEAEESGRHDEKKMYATMSIIRECQRIMAGGLFGKGKPLNDIGYWHYIKALRFSDFYWDPLPLLLAPFLKLIRGAGIRKKQKELIC